MTALCQSEVAVSGVFQTVYPVNGLGAAPVSDLDCSLMRCYYVATPPAVDALIEFPAGAPQTLVYYLVLFSDEASLVFPSLGVCLRSLSHLGFLRVRVQGLVEKYIDGDGEGEGEGKGKTARGVKRKSAAATAAASAGDAAAAGVSTGASAARSAAAPIKSAATATAAAPTKPAR